LLLTRSFAEKFDVKASPSLWVFSAQHEKRKERKNGEERGRVEDKKKRGLCSPLERRADVDVDVKEGGEKNESKQDKKQAKAKARIFLPRISVLWLSHGHEVFFLPAHPQREMKAVKLYNVFRFVSRQKQVLRLRAAQQEERETTMRPV